MTLSEELGMVYQSSFSVLQEIEKRERGKERERERGGGGEYMYLSVYA